MIIVDEEYGTPGVMQAQETPLGNVFGLGFSEGWSDNISVKGYSWYEKKKADGKIISRADAEKRAKDSGVEVKNIGEEGIKEGALDILIERQYQKKRRASLLSAAESGFSKGFLEISGNLTASVLDPVNIAAAFIPVVGEVRYANLLKSAATPLGRAAVRAGVGAVEGAVGAAITEPFSYGFSQQLGDDYTSANSLMNIAFGSVMGAGLHMGAGAIGDAIKAKRSPDMAGPNGKIAQEINALPFEKQMDLNRSVIAQAMDDRHIDISPVRQAQKLEVMQQIDKLDQKLAAVTASRQVDPVALAEFNQQRSQLLSQLGEDVQLEPRIINRESIVSENMVDGKVDLNKASTAMDAEIRSAIESGQSVRLVVGDGPRDIVQVTPEGLVDSTGKVWSSQDIVKSLPQNAATRVEIMPTSQALDPSTGAPIAQNSGQSSFKSPQGVMDQARALAQEPADSRFINEELLTKHKEELAAYPQEFRVEEATAEMQEAINILKEEADALGIEHGALLKDADEAIEDADLFAKALKAMASCQFRKG